MIKEISFQTRARTIDHLGRGQIADAPTAISELWKNAYDAYACDVALHIFDGEPAISAVFDNGLGMSQEDVIGRWLVIGTENKIEDQDEDEDDEPADTLGLPERPKQGEKGIGRLSVAFLAPGTVLVSKSKESDFVVVVVDWRLFENPFLALDDVHLPVQTFANASELAEGLPSLLDTLRSNLAGDDSERGRKIRASWKRFSEYEKNRGLPNTSEAIASLWAEMPLTTRHLEQWPVFRGEAEHGTAMFSIDLNHELAVWVQPNETNEEVDEVKSRLRQTLTAFTDPYSKNRLEFNYEVYVHLQGSTPTRIVGSSDVFGLDDLHDLEHYIDGEFDDEGTFTGRIVAFGQDLGIKKFTPTRPVPARGRDRLGPFSFAIGTYEIDDRRSTHTANQHVLLSQKAEKFAGMFVFRDGLRVMPYGRPDSDFLNFEERRSKHAGRYFWAHRRSFGRMAFSRLANPALKDKAGREGFVDNRAFREMRLLVIEFLYDAARKYFGTDSPVRDDLMPGIMERKLLQKEAADKAQVRRKKGLRQFLREQSPHLSDAIRRTQSLISLAKDTLNSSDRIQAAVIEARANEARTISDSLRPPTPPSRLGDMEEQWRDYRDKFEILSAQLYELDRVTSEVAALVHAETPKDVLLKRVEQQNELLHSQLQSFQNSIDQRFENLRQGWKNSISADVNELNARVEHVINRDITTENLLNVLNLVDATRAELSEKFSSKYEPLIGALDQLVDGIDLQGALDITNEYREELEEQLRDIRSVAQIGITVEIIGHEFDSLESEVRRNLAKLPKTVLDSDAYRHALEAHHALADRLRFLSPLKIGGYRAREKITGSSIADYVTEFFASRFEEQRIDFVASDAFRKISITDLASRIYPVFVNIINNAIYWTSQSKERKIRIDFIEKLTVISDTGPGVDPEDVPRLFNMFFTRRRSGRGVGLYLSRTNLAVAGHKIRLASAGDPTVLGGANFIIEFKGVRVDE